MQKRKINLPLTYEIQDATFDKERFLKLRIKVMHSGLNLNNSYFSSEVIEKARPTLANIPILAFVKKEDGTDSEDFAGHEFEIKITENDMKYVYLGRPIGIIPETNNYSIESDEDGKNFVVVDGYIWKQYANSALDIIERDNIKKVSMEVLIDDYEWEEAYINILNYAYGGITMLGEGVREAMLGARAEIINYSENTISQMLLELKEVLKGGQKGMNLEENVKAVEMTEEIITFSKENEIILASNETTETIEEKVKEPEVEEFEEKKEEEKTEENFEKEKEEEQKEENSEPINYEALVVDLQSEIEALKIENARLQEFVNATHEKAKEDAINELFIKFQELTDIEEAKELKEKAKNMKLSDLETQLYAIRGKYMFTQEQKEEEESSLSGPVWEKLIFQYESKNKDSNKPEWADLVEKRKKEEE